MGTKKRKEQRVKIESISEIQARWSSEDRKYELEKRDELEAGLVAECYVESIKKWVPITFKIDSHTCQSSKDRRRLQLAKAVASFLALHRDDKSNIAYVEPLPSDEGHYAGLPRFLKSRGLSAIDVDLHVIQLAHKLYRQKYSPFPESNGCNPKYIKEFKTIRLVPPVDPSRRSKGNRIFGFEVHLVLRRLAREGFDVSMAVSLLDHFGIEMDRSNIRTQLWYGNKKAKEYPSADLSEDEINSLFNVVL